MMNSNFKVVVSALIVAGLNAPVFAGSIAESLSSQYQASLEGSSGVKSKIQKAAMGAQTCDVAACGNVDYLPSLQAVQSGGEGRATVAAIFEALKGKTVTLANPVGAYVLGARLIFSPNDHSATVQTRRSAYYGWVSVGTVTPLNPIQRGCGVTLFADQTLCDLKISTGGIEFNYPYSGPGGESYGHCSQGMRRVSISSDGIYSNNLSAFSTVANPITVYCGYNNGS